MKQSNKEEEEREEEREGKKIRFEPHSEHSATVLLVEC
jgi:hypothetical protein